MKETIWMILRLPFYRVTCLLTAYVFFLQVNGRALGLDSVKLLDQVKVVGVKLQQFSAGTKFKLLDSLTAIQYQAGSLADILGNEGGLYIKSYGPGSLSTSSFRGGSSEQTAVIWNGVPLNNPMYGLIDLSIVPSFLTNQVTIQYGGAGSIWGSGAMSGAIHLNSVPVFNSGTLAEIGSTVGSFGLVQEQIKLSMGAAKWYCTIKAFEEQVQNNFTFNNYTLPGNPLQTLQHGAFQQQGLLSENTYKISGVQQINLMAWYQNNWREIPPTLLQNQSLAKQQDECIRLSSAWQRIAVGSETHLKLAFIHENLFYHDSLSSLSSNSQTQFIFGELEQVFKIGPLSKLIAGGNFSSAFAESVSGGTNNLNGHNQNKWAGFASYRINSKSGKATGQFSLREETYNNAAVPLVAALGADYYPWECLKLNANLGNIYRTPTINELYWLPGGNPLLLPEQGWNGEIGGRLELGKQMGYGKVGLGITYFDREVKNWIVWLPSNSYWTPQNLQEVWSRGMETNLNYTKTYRQVNIRLDVSTAYVASTNEIGLSPSDASVGKQLIYVPRYSGMGSLMIAYKKLTVKYTQNYAGLRFTSTDDSQYLDPYSVASLFIGYTTALRTKMNWEFYAVVNNCWNSYYETMAYRPMPGINFKVGVKVKLEKK